MKESDLLSRVKDFAIFYSDEKSIVTDNKKFVNFVSGLDMTHIKEVMHDMIKSATGELL